MKRNTNRYFPKVTLQTSLRFETNLYNVHGARANIFDDQFQSLHCFVTNVSNVYMYFGQVKSIEYFSFIHVPLPRDYLKLWPETLKTVSYFCQK